MERRRQSMERIQLNIRLDGERELVKRIKLAAAQQSISVNTFVINAIKKDLGLFPLEETTIEKLKIQLAQMMDEKLSERLGKSEKPVGRTEQMD
jgi:uncharacterized protein (DUF1778 family)